MRLTEGRQITSIYVIPDNGRVMLVRTIRNKHGLEDSANLGFLDQTLWEDFITKEYRRIKSRNATLCEQFLLSDE